MLITDYTMYFCPRDIYLNKALSSKVIFLARAKGKILTYNFGLIEMKLARFKILL